MRSIDKAGSPYAYSFQVDCTLKPEIRRANRMFDVMLRMLIAILFLAALFVALSMKSNAQAPHVDADATGDAETLIAPVANDLTYTRPTQRTKINNYIFDTYGPYPLVGVAIAAGMNQATNSPPEWNRGIKGYSRRFGSNFGIIGIGTTTRYALSELFKEDSLYYRCECSGLMPRLGHAAISTLTARRGMDGHRVFSLPALVAPYAGSMTAVYGWYPKRFGAADGLRLGSYSMLSYMAGNVVLEFFYSGPHSLLTRMHMNNAHGSPVPGPNQ